MSLIAHWPLNGDVNDIIGSRHGTKGSAATWTTSGKIGSALDSTRILNSNATVPHDTELNDKIYGPDADNYSMSFWYYPRGLQSYGCILTKQNGSSWSNATAGFWLWNNDNIRFMVGSGIGGNPANSYVEVNTTLSLNEWYHIVGTVENKILQLYVNGTLINDTADASTLVGKVAVTNDVVLGGGRTTTATDPIDGKLNDCRLYDHVLSKKEIDELGKAKVLHYTFNDFQEPTTNLLTTTLATVTDTSNNMTKTDLGDGRYLIVNDGTGSTTLRFYCDLADLTNGETYTASIGFSDLIGSALSLDWCDVAGSTTVEGDRCYETSLRATYDSTYRFFDVYIATGSSVILFDPQVEHKVRMTPYVTEGTSRTGVITDISGFGNDTTLTEATTPQWVPDAPLGHGSYWFTGDNDYLTNDKLGTDTSMVGFTNCSISFWRKNPPTAVRWLGFAGQDSNHYMMANSTGTSNFYESNCGTNGTHLFYRDGVYQGTIMYAFSDDGWHHYVMTKIDLSLWTEFNISSYSAPTGDWMIHGGVDDVRLYNKELTAAEVLEIYQTKAQLDNRGNLHLSEVNIHKSVDRYSPLNNLVRNGSLEYGDNTNFTAISYDSTNKSFTHTSNATQIIMDEYIEVQGNGYDVFDEYKIECDIKGVNYTSKYYFFIACYDKNKRAISHWDVAHYSNTYTTLAQDLTSGDDWVYLTDVTNWFDAGTDLYDHRQSLSLWLEGTDEYPEYTYTLRHFNITDVDFTLKRVLLQTQYASTTIPSGSPACNSYAGSTFSYIGASNLTTSLTDWYHAEGTALTTPSNSSGPRYGTKYIRLGFLLNREGSSTPTSLIKNLRVTNLTNSTQGTYFPDNTLNLSNKGVYNLSGISELGITRGMTGYWPLNGDTLDYSGEDRDGTAAGAIPDGDSYYFDGVDDTISFGTGADFLPMQAFSVSIWFKSTGSTPTTGTAPGIIAFTYGIRAYLQTDGRLWTALMLSGETTEYAIAPAGYDYRDSLWHHLTYVVDNQRLKAYVDGVVLADVGTPYWWKGTNTWTTNTWQIGRDNNNGTQYFTGFLKKLKLHECGLTAEEVLIEYKHGLLTTGMQLSKTGDLYLNKEIKENL